MFLDKEHMKRVAKQIGKELPDGLVFCLLAWHPEHKQKGANYIGTALRKEAYYRMRWIRHWVFENGLPVPDVRFAALQRAIRIELPESFNYILLTWIPLQKIVILVTDLTDRNNTAYMLRATANKLAENKRPDPIVIKDPNKDGKK